MGYSSEDKAAMIELFMKSNENYANFCRMWRKKYGKHASPPCTKTLKRMVQGFRNGNLGRKKKDQSAVTKEAMTRVLVHVKTNPRDSIRRIGQVLDLSAASVHRILRTDLKMRPYRIRRIFELKAADPPERIRFAEKFRALGLRGKLGLGKLIST